MRIPFAKYHGTGNDFILIDSRTLEHRLHESVIAGMCHRHYGIGADGLILVNPGSRGISYEMIYFNADGRVSSMCGNGARCAFIFAHHLGLAPAKAEFTAFDGHHEASLGDDGLITISMRDVNGIEHRDDSVFILDTGSPHYVKFVDNLMPVDVKQAGRAIRESDEFRANGINVNFAQYADGMIRVRTYERGVEDITMSCGTGVTAVALAAAADQNLEHGPVNILSDGGQLTVDYERHGDQFAQVRLTGPVTHVFDGHLDEDAVHILQ